MGAWAAPAAAATGGGGSSAAGTGGGSSLSILQAKAQELVGEIQADGRTLDELAASYQAAQINFRRLSDQQAALRRSMAAAAAAVATARQALKDQALMAYLAGGAPVISYLPGRPGLDPSLTIAYAEIVAGGQKAAAEDYRATLQAEARQKAKLEANSRQVSVTLASIRSDEQQANATLAARQQALSQVKGQMAVEVAKVQAAQQAAEQAQVKAALAAQGQLPPGEGPAATTATVASEPAGPPANAPAGTSPPTAPQPSAAPSSVPPATATGSTTPPTTGPPTTAPTTAPPTTAPPSSSSGSGSVAQAPGVNSVLAYARAQIGKPYQWGGAGPNSFDCSGLVMMAWEQAGIYFPHLAQDQYNLTARIALSALIPGDLVFFGTPDNVYHVGIYIGNGQMIDAPETGQDVQIQSIYWSSLLGGGRVTSSS